MKRRLRGKVYFYITDYGGWNYTTDSWAKLDRQRFNIGNYFSEDEIRKELPEVELIGFNKWIKKKQDERSNKKATDNRRIVF